MQQPNYLVLRLINLRDGNNKNLVTDLENDREGRGVTLSGERLSRVSPTGY